MAIKRLAIANRGEIAVRIVRAAQSLGIETVQLYSEADADMLAVRMADHSVDIGPAQATKSYLNHDRVLKAVREAGADAIHPGYGFLSESPDFAQAVEQSDLIWVGPKGSTIRRMGDKAAAREAAGEAGVPVVPGTEGRIGSGDQARKAAEEVGYPVMIKAAAGGGGRGIKIAHGPDELAKLVEKAQAEARSAFGDDGLYLERLVEEARHIEVQVLGDGNRALHFFERECSLQRRRQKVWEEAPAATLDDGTRDDLCAKAVALAEAVNYTGAGTVEYLYDENTGQFFFIEMNTRIQVEHPVTELITGTDLVAEQIRIAGGGALEQSQDAITRNGHAIECRINAEDPANDFAPFPGKVESLSIPDGDGVRFDHFLYEGYQIPPFYDSLLGKLIVHADNREAALDRMADALDRLELGGLKTTVPLHKALVANDDVRAGRVHTKWLEAWLEKDPLTGEAA